MMMRMKAITGSCIHDLKSIYINDELSDIRYLEENVNKICG